MFLSPWLGKRSFIKSSMHLNQAHDVAAFKRKEGKFHNYFSSLFFSLPFSFFFSHYGGQWWVICGHGRVSQYIYRKRMNCSLLRAWYRLTTLWGLIWFYSNQLDRIDIFFPLLSYLCFFGFEPSEYYFVPLTLNFNSESFCVSFYIWFDNQIFTLKPLRAQIILLTLTNAWEQQPGSWIGRLLTDLPPAWMSGRIWLIVVVPSTSQPSRGEEPQELDGTTFGHVEILNKVERVQLVFLRSVRRKIHL